MTQSSLGDCSHTNCYLKRKRHFFWTIRQVNVMLWNTKPNVFKKNDYYRLSPKNVHAFWMFIALKYRQPSYFAVKMFTNHCWLTCNRMVYVLYSSSKKQIVVEGVDKQAFKKKWLYHSSWRQATPPLYP